MEYFEGSLDFAKSYQYFLLIFKNELLFKFLLEKWSLIFLYIFQMNWIHFFYRISLIQMQITQTNKPSVVYCIPSFSLLLFDRSFLHLLGHIMIFNFFIAHLYVFVPFGFLSKKKEIAIWGFLFIKIFKYLIPVQHHANFFFINLHINIFYISKFSSYINF